MSATATTNCTSAARRPRDPDRCATSTLDRPSAHANTIRPRNANAWELLARRDQRASVSRSSSVNTSSAFGRQSSAYNTDYA
jgi:hypothetical protein